MADVTPIIKSLGVGVVKITWPGLAGGDTGKWVNMVQYSDKTVHASGDFSAETLTMQGSSRGPDTGEVADAADVINPVTLADPQGSAITKTSDAGEAFLENHQWIRPSMSGSSGGSIDVIVIARGAF